MSESISLVVLRLEIETGYFLTTDLNYNGIIITMFIHFYQSMTVFCSKYNHINSFTVGFFTLQTSLLSFFGGFLTQF